MMINNYLHMLNAIFISPYLVGNSLTSSTVPALLTIACDRGSNPYFNLVQSKSTAISHLYWGDSKWLTQNVNVLLQSCYSLWWWSNSFLTKFKHKIKEHSNLTSTIVTLLSLKIFPPPLQLSLYSFLLDMVIPVISFFSYWTNTNTWERYPEPFLRSKFLNMQMPPFDFPSLFRKGVMKAEFHSPDRRLEFFWEPCHRSCTCYQLLKSEWD